MNRASDFWITDRHQDIALGGMTLELQRQVLAELDASRAREKELEAKLAEPGTLWSQDTARRVAELASADLPTGKVYVGGASAAIDRAIHAALARLGIIGDHPGLRTAAKVRLIRLREDLGRRTAEAQTSSARSTSLESQPDR